MKEGAASKLHEPNFPSSDSRRSRGNPTLEKESSDMGPISQPERLRVRFEGTDRGSATVRLLWDAAPKTCAAIVAMLDGDGRLRVRAVHGRHSGH